MQKWVGVLLSVALWAGILSGFTGGLEPSGKGRKESAAQVFAARAQTSGTNTLYLPVVLRAYPSYNPFGVETHSPFTNSDTLNRAQDLDLSYARMGIRISWRDLQPIEGGPILWDLLANVEQELRILNSANIRPVMVITDSPYWAVLNTRDDQVLTSCAAIRSDKFDDFAYFLKQLVARYSKPEFNVSIWELGNEVDVDPDLVPPDSGYGCWGDADDTYYGGGYYGNMLKTVTPAIKAADPKAQVWIGGLLLDSPNSRPSYFLEGILRAGAAPYFDAVPYHWYAWYWTDGTTNKFDLDIIFYGASWSGGGAYGKATYLKEMMARYGVVKPLIMNEVALGCDSRWAPGDCLPRLSQGFLEAQADFIPRAAMRAIKAGVQQVYWFTLEENAWGYVGLLDSTRLPKPVYYAYRNLIKQYAYGTYQGPVTYHDLVEAYAVQRGDMLRMHVLWSIEDTTISINVPESALIAIYDRDGAEIAKPTPAGGYYTLSVGFSPIYLILKP